MEKQPKKPVMLRAAALLLALVLATSSVVTGHYARYATGSEASDKARVAAFVFETDDLYTLTLDQIQKPGDTQNFTFQVKNHNSAAISEVDEQYVIRMSLRGSLPLQCTLRSGNEIIIAQGAWDLNKQTVTFTFPAAAQDTDSWSLSVVWPDDENSFEYSRAGLAELELTVTAEQIN